MHSILVFSLTFCLVSATRVSGHRLRVLITPIPPQPNQEEASDPSAIRRRIEIGDGSVVVSFVNSASTRMRGCEVDRSRARVRALDADTRTRWWKVEDGAVMRGWVDKCRRTERGMVKRKEFPEIVYPGTRWCGPGDDAADYDDLGEYEEADKCCRRHDNCPADIHAFTTKYHYFNYRPWTVTHCTCDETLFNCLKEVTRSGRDREAKAADFIGDVFFSEADPPCFRLEPGRYCVRRHWSRLWCVEWKEAEEVAKVYSYLEDRWRKVNHTDQIRDKPERQRIWN